MKLYIIAGANGSGKTTFASSLNGGHNIPQNDIIRRFTRSKDLFWNLYRKKVDNWYLFFNADDEFEEVANFTKNEIIELNEDYFKEFLKDLT